MSLNIRLKHSATKDKKPQVADLKTGELALNINSASAAGYALDDTGAVQQMFGTATEVQQGQAEIATQAEVDAGTDDERIVTPAKLGQRITDYTTNTVTPAIAVETAARAAAIAQETADRTADITAEEAARAAADTAEETARIAGDGLRVLKAGDTMTGDLTVPNITVPGNGVIDAMQMPKAILHFEVSANNAVTINTQYNIASVSYTGGTTGGFGNFDIAFTNAIPGVPVISASASIGFSSSGASFVYTRGGSQTSWQIGTLAATPAGTLTPEGSKFYYLVWYGFA